MQCREGERGLGLDARGPQHRHVVRCAGSLREQHRLARARFAEQHQGTSGTGPGIAQQCADGCLLALPPMEHHAPETSPGTGGVPPN